MADYDHVNAAWPAHVPVPSAQEAIAGARILVRLALKHGPIGKPVRPFRGKFQITSGNRRCWTYRGVFRINPDNTSYSQFRSWRGIVHDISHWAGHRLFPERAPHDDRHAFIERVLAEHVVKSGWLDGKLKRPEKIKPPVDVKAKRYEATLAALARWETKKKRAETAIRKLNQRKRYYERTLEK